MMTAAPSELSESLPPGARTAKSLAVFHVAEPRPNATLRKAMLLIALTRTVSLLMVLTKKA